MTDPLSTSTTQTRPPAAAMASGPFSRYSGFEIAWTSAPVAASTSVSASPFPSATHTSGPAAAIASGSANALRESAAARTEPRLVSPVPAARPLPAE